MTEVWFVRHGESEANVEGVVPDERQANLTAHGTMQAARVGGEIPFVPDLIVVTPYPRTMQTALPTLSRFPSSRLEVWPLQEFAGTAAARLANMSKSDKGQIKDGYWDGYDPDYVDGPGAESFNQMVGRVKDSMKKLEQSKDRFVVVFCHGLVMRLMKFMMLNPTLEGRPLMQAFHGYFKDNKIENTEILRLQADSNGVRFSQKPTASPRREAWRRKL